MIATDIEVVKATFAAFAARDVEAVLALAAPDIEFTAVTAMRLEEARQIARLVGGRLRRP